VLVTAVTPRGYCKGVVRAINIVKKATQEVEGPIYILGMIVHNDYIVNALKSMGAHTIEDNQKTRLELLDEVDEGTIIITAHGAGDNVKEKAIRKHLNVIDASCPDVIKTHTLIKKYLAENKDILYIGKAHHPEAEGALAISDRVHLIQSIDDIHSIDPDGDYVMTNQTTMSLYDVYTICEEAKKCLPNITIAKETCNATKIRQQAIASLDDDIDLVIIVGDPRSNNTKKLASIAQTQAHKTTYMIESINDLDITWLDHAHHVAVSSGASTPTSLTNQVIAFIRDYDTNDESTHIKPTIDYSQILK